MPIVAAQLLFTIGVTVALAFELPDKPLYRITQEIRESLQKRLHPELKAAASNSTNSTDSHSRIDVNGNDLNYVYNSKDYYNKMNNHKYYYGNSTGGTNANDILSKKVVKT